MIWATSKPSISTILLPGPKSTCSTSRFPCGPSLNAEFCIVRSSFTRNPTIWVWPKEKTVRKRAIPVVGLLAESSPWSHPVIVLPAINYRVQQDKLEGVKYILVNRVKGRLFSFFCQDLYYYMVCVFVISDYSVTGRLNWLSVFWSLAPLVCLEIAPSRPRDGLLPEFLLYNFCINGIKAGLSLGKTLSMI